MKKLLAVLIAILALWSAPVLAQSPQCQGANYGVVWTPGQWQACFNSLQPILGYTPLNKAGDTMTGKLGTIIPTVAQAGLNLPPGTSPTLPVNGDMWTTSSGLYVQVAGITVGPLIGASGFLPITGGTLTGKLTTTASTTGGAGLNCPQGTAPTSPVNGDIWCTSAGIYVQIAGVTVGPLGTGGGGGSGTVGSGATNQVAAYATGGTAVAGETVAGDATAVVSGSNLNFTISAGAITLAKMANLAADTLIGNNGGSGATPLALTPTQVTAMLNTYTASLQGLVPAAGVNVGYVLFQAGWGALPTNSTIILPQGRITPTNGVPVITADAVNVSTLYYHAFKGGNQVPYYNGVADNLDTIPGDQVSTAMQASSTGVLNSGGVFDMWWVHTGANRICVATNGSGGGWASDTGGSNTARGTGYSQLDFTTRQYVTNKNSLPHCYNGATNYGSVSANQATYLGTIYTTAAGQTGIALRPVPGSGGTANIIGIFNAYNRVKATAFCRETQSWTSTSSSWHAANSSTGESVSWVDGLAEVNVESEYSVSIAAGTLGGADSVAIGVNLDNLSAMPGGYTGVQSISAGLSAIGDIYTQTTSGDNFYPQLGFHYIQAMENDVEGGGAAFNPPAPGNSNMALIWRGEI
jgi:hypothetical protein